MCKIGTNGFILIDFVLQCTHQFICVLGPGQVADLRAGVGALQGLACQSVPEAYAAVGSSASRGQKAVLVRRPGNGLYCSQVLRVLLHWKDTRVVPHKKL